MISKFDQVKVILKDLGPQTNNDLSFLTSEHAVQYVRELESSSIKLKDNHKVLDIRMGDLISGLKIEEMKMIAMNFL